MAKNFNSRALAVSQKVYGWLLRAYPKAHREEYGAAMAQLFRDQCRDAWNEAHGWGVAKLWLRVLPDLVKTSIIERLAAINERKSMSDKMTALIQPRKVFLKVFAVVFLLVLGYSILTAFLLPETYESTARIKVENNQPSGNYDPYFIQAQFEIMQSQAVLGPVIDKLNLNVNWGKKYFAGETLKPDESLKILRSRLMLQPIRNTQIVSISVFGDDKNEAAQIANAIAESYRDYRTKSYPEASASKLLPTLVQIVDAAQPGRAPVRPNKTLNITLGAVFGIVSASALGAIVAFVATRINKRKQKLNAPV